MAVLREHWKPLEADFQQTYGLNLTEVWRIGGSLSLRRVWVLLEQLPPDSRFARAIGAATSWSTTDYLLASIADRVAENSWLFASAHSKNSVPRPEPLRRPGSPTTQQAEEEKTKKRVLTGAQLKTWLAE